MEYFLSLPQHLVSAASPLAADWGLQDWLMALKWMLSPLMIVFWLLLAACALGLVRWLVLVFRRGPVVLAADRSLTLLRERYARGDIDREQYLAIKRELTG